MQKVVIKRITLFRNAKSVSSKSISLVPGVGVETVLYTNITRKI